MRQAQRRNRQVVKPLTLSPLRQNRSLTTLRHISRQCMARAGRRCNPHTHAIAVPVKPHSNVRRHLLFSAKQMCPPRDFQQEGVISIDGDTRRKPHHPLGQRVQGRSVGDPIDFLKRQIRRPRTRICKGEPWPRYSSARHQRWRRQRRR